MMCPHSAELLMAWSVERSSSADRINPAGRRVYLHEQALARSGLLSEDRCTEMVEVALSLFVPRRIEHAVSELALFGGLDVDPNAVTESVVVAARYREAQSSYLRGMDLRIDGGSTAFLKSETVVANCFFQNYFTLATSAAAAARMFADNATMTELRSEVPEDLSVVRPRHIRLSREQRRQAVEVVESIDWNRPESEVLTNSLSLLEREVGRNASQTVARAIEVESAAMVQSLRNTTYEQARAV